MATTSYGVNDALAVKLWSKKLAVEVSKATAIAPLIGTSSNSIIQLKSETQKGKGDKVTFGLRKQLVGDGVSESSVLEGNEEALSTYSDSIVINELDHAVRVKNEGTIDVQRVPFSLRDEATQGLTDWYADRMSMMFFIQACGFTAPTLAFEGRTVTLKDVHWGFNSPIAPSSGRIIRAGSQANDQSLTSADVFDLNLIDKAVEAAMYVMYLHPYQVTDLRTNTSTGQWLDIQKAVERRGSDNPIFTGALGVYNNVVLREAEHVVTGVNASTSAQITTVRRAVLLGAQAAVCAYGMNKGPTRYTTVEKTFDYDRELGIAAKTIMGMKKTVFDSTDFGTVVVSTYAAAHS